MTMQRKVRDDEPEKESRERGGKRMAAARRTLGQWRGRVRMSDDFDAPLPDTDLAAWFGDQSRSSV
jgi:hypothetical protein